MRRDLVASVVAGLIVAMMDPRPLSAQAVTRLAITPSARTVVVGDSLRLTAQALDASGTPVAGVTIRFSALGGRMQGSVDSLGWVRAGAPGTIPISVVAITPNARPFSERVEVRAVPGPAARVDIAPTLSRLLVGQRMRLDATVYSATGDQRDDRVVWASSNTRVLRVADGLVTAIGSGTSTVSARAGAASSQLGITVVPNAGVTIALTPDRIDARQGDVIRFTATVKDRRGAPIPGLHPTWSFSPGQGAIDQDGAFVGNAPGKYLVTASFGDRSADAAVTLSARDVRRAATVVGRLPRTQFYSSEVWVHPNGRTAYLGTALGGDRIYAIDISNPAAPVITDSIVANSRSMNDLMTTADGQWLVFTREQAADRKNGIVIASTADPAHPKVVSEFTEGVTAGVHSAFVYTQPKFGTHVYLTNSGTGSLNIVDINDPHHPKLVSEWRTKETRAGRSLHDIDVKDGLAYVSYWSDGLVILDVGNGIKGGTPASPKFVSNYKYNAEALYTDATVRYGPGFISGTHTAWRHKNYVFIADEVFPPSAPTGTWDVANIRAYGRLQVVDVSNIEKPRSVAWYEPEYGGVHNVWVAGDTLYLGAYNGGFHAFDVSGELRGDLKAQGREIVDLSPADANGVVPNKAFTWGVVVKDGLAYVNDMITGLWIVRIEPKKVVP
jgi:hypothetical protein